MIRTLTSNDKALYFGGAAFVFFFLSMKSSSDFRTVSFAVSALLSGVCAILWALQ